MNGPETTAQKAQKFIMAQLEAYNGQTVIFYHQAAKIIN